MSADGRRSTGAFTPPGADARRPAAAPATGDGKRRSMPWQAQGGTGEPAPAVASMTQIKTRVHRRILERLNLSTLDKLERDEVVATIAKVVQDLVVQEQLPLNVGERELLVRQVVDEIFGLGPVEPLMQDPDVADILVDHWLATEFAGGDSARKVAKIDALDIGRNSAQGVES